jgi:5'-nucleotidase
VRILLANDDGIDSPGLHALAAGLATLGEVIVVAPLANQSAVARGITLRRDLVVTEAPVAGATQAFSLDGTPVDCVRFGIIGIGGGYDAVVAGANLGHNLGDDVTYSGTVAAAFEGLLFGIPAFAVSQGALDGGLGWTGGAGFDFTTAARFTPRLVAATIAEGFAPGTMLNVNVPADAAGVAQATLGRRLYRDALRLVEDRGTTRVYRLYGGIEEAADNGPDTDIAVVASGRIAITPLHLDLAVREAEHLARIDLPGLLR